MKRTFRINKHERIVRRIINLAQVDQLEWRYDLLLDINYADRWGIELNESKTIVSDMTKEELDQLLDTITSTDIA